jgi:hypothetical protein
VVERVADQRPAGRQRLQPGRHPQCAVHVPHDAGEAAELAHVEDADVGAAQQAEVEDQSVAGREAGAHRVVQPLRTHPFVVVGRPAQDVRVAEEFRQTFVGPQHARPVQRVGTRAGIVGRVEDLGEGRLPGRVDAGDVDRRERAVGIAEVVEGLGAGAEDPADARHDRRPAGRIRRRVVDRLDQLAGLAVGPLHPPHRRIPTRCRTVRR